MEADPAYKHFINVVVIVMGFKVVRKNKENIKKDKEFFKNFKTYRKKYIYNHVMHMWVKELILIHQETVNKNTIVNHHLY